MLSKQDSLAEISASYLTSSAEHSDEWGTGTQYYLKILLHFCSRHGGSAMYTRPARLCGQTILRHKSTPCETTPNFISYNSWATRWMVSIFSLRTMIAAILHGEKAHPHTGIPELLAPQCRGDVQEIVKYCRKSGDRISVGGKLVQRLRRCTRFRPTFFQQ